MKTEVTGLTVERYNELIAVEKNYKFNISKIERGLEKKIKKLKKDLLNGNKLLCVEIDHSSNEVVKLTTVAGRDDLIKDIFTLHNESKELNAKLDFENKDLRKRIDIIKSNHYKAMTQLLDIETRSYKINQKIKYALDYLNSSWL